MLRYQSAINLIIYKVFVFRIFYRSDSKLIYSYFQGWYIIAYALGIYHLNLFIAFLTPKIDPALVDYEGKFKDFTESIRFGF